MATFGKKPSGNIEERVDLETGEKTRVLTNKPLYEKILTGGWFMAMQDGFEWLSKQNLTGEQLRVLLYVMSKMEFENFLLITQKEVAEKLGLKTPNVSRAFKLLVEKGILIEGARTGNVKSYKLDPNLGYKGKAKNLINDLRECADNNCKSKNLKVIEGGKKHEEA